MTKPKLNPNTKRFSLARLYLNDCHVQLTKVNEHKHRGAASITVRVNGMVTGQSGNHGRAAVMAERLLYALRHAEAALRDEVKRLRRRSDVEQGYPTGFTVGTYEYFACSNKAYATGCMRYECTDSSMPSVELEKATSLWHPVFGAASDGIEPSLRVEEVIRAVLQKRQDTAQSELHKTSELLSAANVATFPDDSDTAVLIEETTE